MKLIVPPVAGGGNAGSELAKREILLILGPAWKTHLKLMTTFVNLLFVMCSIWVEVIWCRIVEGRVFARSIESQLEVRVPDSLGLMACSQNLTNALPRCFSQKNAQIELSVRSKKRCDIEGYNIIDVPKSLIRTLHVTKPYVLSRKTGFSKATLS